MLPIGQMTSPRAEDGSGKAMPSNRTKTGSQSASFEGATTKRSKKGGAENGAAPVRQNELLQIAADLFADRGYNATTVRDIADEAGILSGSLYHHFDSKESMIDAILSRFIEQTLDRYEAVVDEGRGPTETF